jgi:hypothetical protein
MNKFVRLGDGEIECVLLFFSQRLRQTEKSTDLIVFSNHGGISIGGGPEDGKKK